MAYYIGIDLGTSSVKAVLASASGEIIKSCNYTYKTVADSSGRSEIDPEAWFGGVMHCLRRLTREIKDIRAIGVTGQMHSLVLLGRDEEALRPAMLWNDLRTASQVQKLRSAAQAYGLDSIADIVSTGSPAANLLYIREIEPDTFRKLHRLLIGHNYITYRLTGHIGADYCEASTSSLYDIENRRWAATLLKYIGLNESALPEILPACRRAGALRSDICAELGLTAAPDVTEGTGDNIASMLALRTPCLSLGTSGVFIERRSSFRKDKKGKNILLSLTGEEPSVVVQGVVQSVGSSMEWLKTILGAASVKELLENLPEQVDPGLLFFPHLNGDKTLYRDSTLRGAILGLSLTTRKEDLAAAAAEGLCFALRQMIDQVSDSGASAITVTGGLTKSCRFMQMLADVLECELAVLEGNPGAVFGAVHMAMQMAGENLLPQAQAQKTYVPSHRLDSYYQEKYEKYTKIRDNLPR